MRHEWLVADPRLKRQPMGGLRLIRCDFDVFQPLRRRVANALKLGTLIGLAGSFAFSAAAGIGTMQAAGLEPAVAGSHRALARATAPTSAQPQNEWAALSEIAPDELAAYLAANDTLRVPFDSTLAAIRTCLRGPENAILTCLDEMSGKTACETDSAQCAYAAEQAWQVYIEHYLRLLRKPGVAATPDASQKAWTAYVRETCDFESALYPNDAPMRNAVRGACRAGKAQGRALELRSSLIDSEN